jgi:hypothetical protein
MQESINVDRQDMQAVRSEFLNKAIDRESEELLRIVLLKILLRRVFGGRIEND